MDKSLPHKSIVMRRPAGTPCPEVPTLPEGFSFRLWRPGDAAHWAAVETAAGEFDSQEAAEAYYAGCFAPFPDELARRQLFLTAPDGSPVGNFTAWWGYYGRRRYPNVHWVAVKPGYQGQGLGRAIVAQGLRLIAELEGDQDVYLTSQTWSHRALRIYRAYGFIPAPDAPWPWEKGENRTAEALAILAECGLW